MTESRADRMQAIYDQVPEVADCKGHCWISCGPASMTPWERRRLALAGHRVTPDEEARREIRDFWCEALGPDGRCLAYSIRPLICAPLPLVPGSPTPGEAGTLPRLARRGVHAARVPADTIAGWMRHER